MTGYVVTTNTGLKDDKYSILKDPDAVLDYPFDWTAWLPEGDTIATATGAIVGTAVLDSCDVDGDGLIVTPFVSGGAAGETCTLTVHIVTTEGREDDRTIYLKIKER
jgi:hypothetical protein